jgi:hypothetical protein
MMLGLLQHVGRKLGVKGSRKVVDKFRGDAAVTGH